MSDSDDLEDNAIRSELHPDVCPECGEDTTREEVDVGVGIQYGPRRCDFCGWSDPPLFDFLSD